MFLGTPGMSLLYGTIFALIIVVILGGKTTGVNVMRGVIVQVGQDMEEAARVAGAGFMKTYFKIWLPLLMPTLVLLATLNFVGAAGAVSSVVLLAYRGTTTVSMLALQFANPSAPQRETPS